MTVEGELRRWVRGDAGALLLAVDASPDLATQFGGDELGTTTACQDFIDRYLSKQEPDGHNLAITVDGRAVGNVGLSNIERRHDTAWVHYWVATPYRRRGLATRALATLAARAYLEFGLFRLELGHRVNNPASCSVACGAGFPAEGIERAKLRYGDRRFDVETHARLATDPTPAALPLRCDDAY